METNPSTCIAILGMGRSGTSAMAGALKHVGVDLGKNLIGGDKLNPKGYFENSVVVSFDETLLREMGSSLADFRYLDDESWVSSATVRHRPAILALLRREFQDSPLFAMKDPRLCRVWPIWTAVMADRWRLRSIVMLRHPIEVVQSLYSLGTSTNHGLLWWSAHTLHAEQHSRAWPRAIVPYDDLIANPRATLDIISNSLGLVWPVPAVKAESVLNAFLDKSMRHYWASAPSVREEADPRILSFAERVHGDILVGGSPGTMDDIRTEFVAMVQAYSGWRHRKSNQA